MSKLNAFTRPNKVKMLFTFIRDRKHCSPVHCDVIEKSVPRTTFSFSIYYSIDNQVKFRKTK